MVGKTEVLIGVAVVLLLVALFLVPWDKCESYSYSKGSNAMVSRPKYNYPNSRPVGATPSRTFSRSPPSRAVSPMRSPMRSRSPRINSRVADTQKEMYKLCQDGESYGEYSTLRACELGLSGLSDKSNTVCVKSHESCLPLKLQPSRTTTPRRKTPVQPRKPSPPPRRSESTSPKRSDSDNISSQEGWVARSFAPKVYMPEFKSSASLTGPLSNPWLGGFQGQMLRGPSYINSVEKATQSSTLAAADKVWTTVV